jgi:hypothetical protein
MNLLKNYCLSQFPIKLLICCLANFNPGRSESELGYMSAQWAVPYEFGFFIIISRKYNKSIIPSIKTVYVNSFGGLE